MNTENNKKTRELTEEELLQTTGGSNCSASNQAECESNVMCVWLTSNKNGCCVRKNQTSKG